jgi:hypothetical protein
MGGACSRNEKYEMHSKFLLKKLKGRDHLVHVDVDWRLRLQLIVKK